MQDFQPKTLRIALGILIEKESGGNCKAIVMDPSDQQPGESDIDFFRRLEIENSVDSYFIVVPARTKILGTTFGEGILARDFQLGRAPYVALFPEMSTVRELANGDVEFTEKGKRTRYLKALARKSRHVEPWDGLEDLRDLAVARAMA